MCVLSDRPAEIVLRSRPMPAKRRSRAVRARAGQLGRLPGAARAFARGAGFSSCKKLPRAILAPAPMVLPWRSPRLAGRPDGQAYRVDPGPGEGGGERRKREARGGGQGGAKRKLLRSVSTRARSVWFGKRERFGGQKRERGGERRWPVVERERCWGARAIGRGDRTREAETGGEEEGRPRPGRRRRRRGLLLLLLPPLPPQSNSTLQI